MKWSVGSGFRCAALVFLAMAASRPAYAVETRPNIVWIIVDDMSANFSCYGETTIKTPNVDRLAAKYAFRNAFVLRRFVRQAAHF